MFYYHNIYKYILHFEIFLFYDVSAFDQLH